MNWLKLLILFYLKLVNIINNFKHLLLMKYQKITFYLILKITILIKFFKQNLVLISNNLVNMKNYNNNVVANGFCSMDITLIMFYRNIIFR